MANDKQKLALSIAEFAKLCGLGRSFLYEEIKRGDLNIRKAGRRSLILREEGVAWLANCRRHRPRQFPTPKIPNKLEPHK
jgi:excisionase family DNA binding protein